MSVSTLGAGSTRTVLVVDDDAAVRRVLEEAVRRAGYEAIGASCAENALSILDARAVEVVVTDVRMPGMSGTTFAAEVRRRFDDLPVIVVTAFPSVESAVDALRAGATDYLQKPFRAQDVLDCIEKALVASGSAAGSAVGPSEGDLVTCSDSMAQLSRLLRRVARTDATVLVRGETGVGKEVVARAIHAASPRARGPFLKVHCAALPETLLESELFGYERGAFTGAVTRKPGRLALAEGGTLFLDEIGDISLATQVKLLRVLQNREYERVGGTQTQVANVRIVAATHRDLEAMCADGSFRDDLFYRLAVFPVVVPPLRERPEDLPEIARQLLARCSAYAEGPIALTAEALEVLAAHAWPGNVRELANVIERLVIVTGQGHITAAQIREQLRPAARSAAARVEREDDPSSPERTSSPALGTDGEVKALAAARLATEREAVDRAMAQAKGNRTHAAKLLGVSRRTLYTKLHQLGLDDR
ncbi:MAG: sigma-54-dependent Fis family transcriptional regulator [Deltaproteobacteria bacterium]|nr:sigma-54-dependent Fis family transcriptional regulator [Deltaproteobacteria bacterium]